MSDLDPALRTHLDTLVRTDRVVLFMKGSRTAPRCGFSARVVALLDGLLDTYATVDVLSDDSIRDGMKAYADWPTFPQVWVDGALIGGADIVEQLASDGSLAEALGAPPAPPCAVTLTEAARQRIVAVLDGRAPRLRLTCDADFRYGFAEVGDLDPGDVTLAQGPVTLVLDRATARRMDGATMDFDDDGLLVDNPNEPPRVRSLTVHDLATWRREDPEGPVLLDVRTPDERSIACIPGARLLDDDAVDWLRAQPRDTPLVFACHHGVRSRAAAEHFLTDGFTRVFNLEGGIDAWSLEIDPGVPRY